MKKVILSLLCLSFSYLGGESPISTEQSNENVRLLNEVLSTIKGHYNHFNVNVYVENGEVTLKGTVHSTEDKRQIEQDVQKLGGVKKIKNELDVVK